MSSETSSSAIAAPAEDKPVLTFLATVAVVIGVFYVSRKYIGSIPAAIAAYLLYVYRDDLKKEVGELYGRH
jgi:NAD(P)H-dependent FMN reductase